MATSRSSDSPVEWIAGASIFSGRRDPQWKVPQAVVDRLLQIWESLKPWPDKIPLAPPLGYRGCFVRDNVDRQWTAFGGVVTLETSRVSASRKDVGKQFEKTLLASAPEGLIPASLIPP
jgi:hypothetical protein